MNNIIIYLSFLLFTTVSCQKVETQQLNIKVKTTEKKISIKPIYNEVLTIKKGDYDINNQTQKTYIQYKTLKLKIRYIEEKAYISISRENKLLVDWHPVQMNFFYDTTYEDAEKDIHLLLKGNDTNSGYILLPSFTEQFATYFVYQFKGKNLNYIGEFACNDFQKGTFYFDENSNSLYISFPDKKFKLDKIDDKSGIESSKYIIEKDIKRIKIIEKKVNNANLQKKPSSINIDRYINNEDFFIKNIDVDKDGVLDKIVSSNRYKGDSLLVFLANKNTGYKVALQTTNFSEDGGNQISDIKESANGFIIITLFPERSYLEKKYAIKYTNNKWILNTITSTSSSWQDSYNKKCIKKLNINLTNNVENIMNTIVNIPSDCKKIKRKSL